MGACRSRGRALATDPHQARCTLNAPVSVELALQAARVGASQHAQPPRVGSEALEAGAADDAIGGAARAALVKAARWRQGRRRGAGRRRGGWRPRRRRWRPWRGRGRAGRARWLALLKEDGGRGPPRRGRAAAAGREGCHASMSQLSSLVFRQAGTAAAAAQECVCKLHVLTLQGAARARVRPPLLAVAAAFGEPGWAAGGVAGGKAARRAGVTAAAGAGAQARAAAPAEARVGGVVAATCHLRSPPLGRGRCGRQ